MLVISRKYEEDVIIGDDILIRVVGFFDRHGQKIPLQGLRVRLAIDAPREIPIVRGELLTREAPIGNV